MHQLWYNIIHLYHFSLTCSVFFHRIFKGIVVVFLFSFFPFPLFPFSLSPEVSLSNVDVCRLGHSENFFTPVSENCLWPFHTQFVHQKDTQRCREGRNCRESEEVPGLCEQETSAAVTKQLRMYKSIYTPNCLFSQKSFQLSL